MSRVGGIVLAAGASRRAGGCKALATLGGEPFVARAVRVLREGGCGDVIVVVGPPYGEAIAAALGDVWIVQNLAPDRGMLSSLRLAVEVGLDAEWDGAVVSLVDQPHVRAATVRRLVDAFGDCEADVVRPRFAGLRGHPYLVARTAFAPLLAASDEHGARPVLRALPRRLDVDVDDPAVLEDLDRRADLAAAGARVP